ncbi:MAG: hypothetical protein M3512_00910 [Bacteroidota bacterium]|nr:hypothetical protein [Bacteroidota bacterium]
MLIDIALYLTYGLIIIAALGAIILPLINSLGDPGSLIKTGAGIGALLVIFFISYAIAGNEVMPFYAKGGVGPELSKWVGAALITMYVLFVIAVVSILVTEVSKLFR